MLRERKIGQAACRARPVQRDHEGAAAEEGDRGAGEPVRMDEIGTARCGSAGGDHREEQKRGEPRPTPESPDDAALARAGEAEVAIRARRNDLDLDLAVAQVLDRVEDELAGQVSCVARY